MLRKIFFFILMVLAINTYAQKGKSTKYFDLNVGVTNPVEPFAAGYRTPTFGLFHANLGYRFMVNDRFGYRFIAGYDKISNSQKNSLPFNSNYMRGSVEAMIDLSKVLNFREFTNFFGLLMHGGVGASFLSGSGQSITMGHFVNGITLQGFVSPRLAINFDLTRVNHVYQQRTFDLTKEYSELGFDGFIMNVTIGASLKLNKGK
jgi:OOP family OmpA-OmpF porin